MNETRPDKPDNLVCYCSGTTAEKIQALLARQIDDLDAISRQTGACSGCGSCESVIVAMIRRHHSGKPNADSQPACC